MTCYEMLKPFVTWAAHDQVTDPFRYVLGFQLAYIHTDGTVTTIDGKVDINDAKFASDGERFAIRLHGSGTLSSRPPQSSTATDPNATATAGSASAADERKVIIQMDANNERILVRIGDVVLHKVIDRFTAECREGFIVGYGDNKAYHLSLQKMERIPTGWRIADASEGNFQSMPVAPREATAPTPPSGVQAVVLEPDDLLRIEGIGPKSATALNSIGITTYAQLATKEPAQLQKDLINAGLDVMPGATSWWPAQAALAANGHWNQLKAVQTELLKGGRFALPDDLEKINGIGPATARKLDEMGITTYRQLAAKDPEVLEAELKAAGVNIPLGTAVTWPEQAKLASEQRWVDLEATQRELNKMQNDLQATSEMPKASI